MHGVERHREVLKPSQLRQAPTKRNYIPTDQGREMKPLSSKPLQGLGSTARLHNTTYEARASTTCDIRPWPVTKLEQEFQRLRKLESAKLSKAQRADLPDDRDMSPLAEKKPGQ